MKQQEIPIFFAVDDAYVPFLTVTIQSLSENINEDNLYVLHVLYTNITDENKNDLKKFENDSIKIEFVNVQEKIEKLKDKLQVRDYFSNATYYRILIPDMYPQYDKVIYLDADTVVLEDIAILYNTDMEDNLVAGVPEPWFAEYKEFQTYALKVIGVSDYKEYINVGVLLMNLKALREMHFGDIFTQMLDVVKYRLLQDEDYINKICLGRIKYIDPTWNVCGYLYNKPDPKIVHYTLFKPWHRKEMLNKDYFWKYAEKTKFYDYISSLRTDESESKADTSLKVFVEMAEEEVNNFVNE